jgi:signal transduction histidine kinase
VLVIAAAAMLWLLGHSLVREVDLAADSRAADIAADLVHSPTTRIPEAVPTPGGQIAAAQILGPDGQVLRTSDPSFAVPLTDLAAAHGRTTGLRARSGYDEDLRVAVRVADTPTGSYTVLVAGDIEGVERAVEKATALLAVGGPIVVLVSAGATYLLVGRSLHSVEQIRAQVARIGAADLSERVPVPQARDEIARLARTMNDMLARVQAGHLAQRRFVGDASHELRSPLSTVTAALELARDRPEVLDRELITGTLLPEAERMHRLLADLLTLAAADEHGLELRTVEVDLDDIVAAEAVALRRRNVVTVGADARPVRIHGDPARLTRAVRNIVDNAATHARSRVTVGSQRVGERAHIIVDDDGPGVPSTDRRRIFDRFVRLEPDRARETGGAGLGLAIVAEIVTAHGGTVTVDRSPWGGARFVIDLPIGGPAVGVHHPIPDTP